MALNTGPLNSASLNSSGQGEFISQGVASAALGIFALTATIGVTQTATASQGVGFSSSADGFISTYISAPTTIDLNTVAAPRRFVYPIESASIDFSSFANAKREVSLESENTFGITATAAQTVKYFVFGSLDVRVQSYALAMNIKQNGVGDALTNLSAGAEGVVARHFDVDTAFDLSADSLNGLVTRNVSSDAVVGVASSGYIRVRQPGFASANIDFYSSGQHTRQQYAIGIPARIDISSSEVVPSIVQYFDAAANVCITSNVMSMSVKRRASPQPILVKINTSGWALEEVFISRLNFIATGLGSYNHLTFAIGSTGFVSEPAHGSVTRYVQGEAFLKATLIVEPGINGEHEASASGSFGISASTDSLRVLHNIKAFGTVDFFQWNTATHGVAGSGNTAFSMDSLSATFSVTTYGESTANVSISSEGTPIRTRRVFGRALVSISSFEFSTLKVAFSSKGSLIEVDAQGLGTVIRGGAGEVSIEFGQVAKGVRKRLFEGLASIDVLSARAQALSNLTVSAPLNRTFVLDPRQSEFEVPFEDRRFIV